MLHQVINFSNKYRIVRGMAAYALLWPMGSIIQQTFVEGKNIKTYDWKKCLRFSIFGGCVIGPTMYLWMRFASILWPARDLKTSLSKGLVEQLAYDPFAISSFLFGMSLMEGRTRHEAYDEVTNKFLDTYKVGVVYWPMVQTINFTFIPAKNQVVFTSFFSMLWTSFLAYMKHLELREHDESLTDEHEHHHHHYGFV